MQKKIFNIAYYLNNTIFAFLFIELILTGVLFFMYLLKTPEENVSGVFLGIILYNAIGGTITKLLIVFALYQSFIALNNLKRGNSTETSWHKYFFRSGMLFCIASVTNLLNIEKPSTPKLSNNFSSFYTSEEMYLGLNSSSVFIFAIGILFLFISVSKFNQNTNL